LGLINEKKKIIERRGCVHLLLEKYETVGEEENISATSTIGNPGHSYQAYL
jgi:hypothetical protein